MVNVITLEKKTRVQKDQLRKYGRLIADAFMNEPGSYPGPFTRTELERYFSCVCELGIRGRGFYVLKEDETEKGYIIYWKRSRQASWLLKMIISLKILFVLPNEKITKFMEPLKDWKDYEEMYKDAGEYVDVFLVCIPVAYQHQGYFRRMMQDPLQLARNENIPCILETDSLTKRNKYASLGMKMMSHARLTSGVDKFIMEYR